MRNACLCPWRVSRIPTVLETWSTNTEYVRAVHPMPVVASVCEIDQHKPREWERDSRQCGQEDEETRCRSEFLWAAEE